MVSTSVQDPEVLVTAVVSTVKVPFNVALPAPDHGQARPGRRQRGESAIQRGASRAGDFVVRGIGNGEFQATSARENQRTIVDGGIGGVGVGPREGHGAATSQCYSPGARDHACQGLRRGAVVLEDCSSAEGDGSRVISITQFPRSDRVITTLRDPNATDHQDAIRSAIDLRQGDWPGEGIDTTEADPIRRTLRVESNVQRGWAAVGGIGDCSGENNGLTITIPIDTCE